MISGNYSSTALRNGQNQMNELRNQYRNKEIDSDEYREKLAEVKDYQEEARLSAAQAGLNAASNISSLFGYMNNGGGNNTGVWGSGTFDTTVFFSSKNELSNLQALNSARIGIENRARTLVGEIGRGKARGFDVSDRQEALSNLTGNLDILNKNLNNSIDNALSNKTNDRKTIDIIGRLRDSLAPSEVPEGEAKEAATTPAAEIIEEETANTNASAAFTESAESSQPSFAAPSTFEGGAAEQAVQASQEQDPDDMSIAAQIANDAKSEYAQSVDIMNEEEIDKSQTAPESAVESGVTPANV
jgi:hypothetical protein